MRFGSVCSGIEAASVAWHPLGWRAAWLAEIEPFPSAVLAHHYPEVLNHGNMTALPQLIRSGKVEAPDLFCGGTPCQAFSVAGLRRSLDDERGNLSLKFVEIADAIDDVRRARGHAECIVFWENVPGVLSTKDNAFGCFLAGLAGEDLPLEPPGDKWSDSGVVLGPQRTVAWRILDAQYFGLAQRRKRVFVVASAREAFNPASVLFEFNGVRRDSAPSREAGQRVAPTIAGCANGGGANGPGRDVDSVESLQVARCVTAGEGGRLDGESCTFITHSLRGEGLDASEGGTLDEGQTPVLVALGTDRYNGAITGEVAATLGTPGSSVNGSGPTVMQPVAHAFDARQSAVIQYGDKTGPLDTDGHSVAVAVQASQSGVRFNDIVGTLDANYGSRRHNGVMQSMQVRRLTPVECERLQGFPDDWTHIPWRGKPADQCPDGPRYKALGNSWAVPVVRWIGQRIQEAL